MSDINRAILITQLTVNVTEKQLSDFFSFCGKIVSLSIRRKGDNVEAVLHFEKESSTSTALLLNNAIIDGTPIKVQVYTEEKLNEHTNEEEIEEKIVLEKQALESGEKVSSEFSEERLSEPQLDVHHVPEEKITTRPPAGSAASVIASILASGYVLTMDALSSAKKIDEDKGISQSLQEGGETVKTKVQELDTQLKVSESAGNVGRSISEGLQNFDSEYHISENANAASAYIGAQLGAIGTTIAAGVSETLATPAVQNTLLSINSWGTNVSRSIGNFLKPVGDSISSEINQIKNESSIQIAEKQKVRKEAEGVQEPNEVEMAELETDDAEAFNPEAQPPPPEEQQDF